MSFHVPEEFRMRTHPTLGTDSSYGNNGAFRLHRNGRELGVIASDASDWDPAWGEIRWEHVSVSLPDRCPTWDEMCYVRSLFWDKEDCIVEFHPPESMYVNLHRFCLHLWRPINATIPIPPRVLVG